MDIKLPGKMNGLEAAVEICTRFGIPFAYMTGYETPEIMDKAMATDPIGLFLKPLNCQAIQIELDETFKKEH